MTQSEGRREQYKNVDIVSPADCYPAYPQILSLTFEYDENNDLSPKSLFSPGFNKPICMIDSAAGNAVYYYHFDGLGSVIALSNENKEIVERYSYDVFGEPNTTSSLGNPYLFTGRRYDPEAGLYYYRARYYDYYLGRFVQTDPIGNTDSMNLYTYCGSNPLKWIDPLGLCKDTGNWDLFWEWFFGKAPERRIYNAQSGRTQDLMKWVGTGLAQQAFIDAKGDFNRNNPFVYQYDFGFRGLMETGLNPTGQFTGSAEIQIYSNPDGKTQTVTIINRTSMKSFLYHLSPESWNRPTGRWMDNAWQEYRWEEPLKTQGISRSEFDFELFLKLGP